MPNLVALSWEGIRSVVFLLARFLWKNNSYAEFICIILTFCNLGTTRFGELTPTHVSIFVDFNQTYLVKGGWWLLTVQELRIWKSFIMEKWSLSTTMERVYSQVQPPKRHKPWQVYTFRRYIFSKLASSTALRHEPCELNKVPYTIQRNISSNHKLSALHSTDPLSSFENPTQHHKCSVLYTTDPLPSSEIKANN